MKLIKCTIIFVLVIFFNKIIAQNTIVNGEVGVYLGPTFFQGDYGESGNFKSSSSNVGASFGVAYIMNFSNSRYRSELFSTLADHVKGRFEFSYAKIKLKHDPVPISETNPQYANFKEMSGETKITNLGFAAEIYISSIIRNTSKFKPYLILGSSMTWANPDMSSTLPIPLAYTTGNKKIFLDKENAISFTYGAGTRFTLKDVDLVFEMNMQSFLSDRIDGLDPEVSGDKNNDSSVSFKFGAVFSLDRRR